MERDRSTAFFADMENSSPVLICSEIGSEGRNFQFAHKYARKLKALSDELSDTLLIIMRIYFEKPRTTIGWKGLINDPHLNGSFDVSHGLEQARELLLWMAELELPVGTEALDPVTPQYLADLFSWTPLEREPPNHKLIEKWLVVCPHR